MSFRSILVDIDSAATAQPALDCAVALARTTRAQINIVDAFYAAGGRRFSATSFRSQSRSERRRRLAAIATALHPLPACAPSVSGVGMEAIVRQVVTGSHDLVIRSRDRDVVESGDRSVTERLSRQCPCSVWVVGSGAPAVPARIVAAIDLDREDDRGRQQALQILDAALQLAAVGDGVVHMLHAWRPIHDQRVRDYAAGDEYDAYLDSTEQRASARLARLAEACGAKLAGVRLALCRGALEDVLPRFVVAEGIDVVVIGTRHRTRVPRRWFAGTAEKLMKRLPCSVLTVKGPR